MTTATEDLIAGETGLDDMLEKLRRDKAAETASVAIENARFRAVGQRSAAQCFFTSLALSLKAVPAWGIDTMATDGTQMMYNPDFTNGLTPDECHGVSVGHEPMHCGMLHFSRFPGLIAAGYEMSLLNEAADLELNQMLIDAGFVLPKCAIFPGKGNYKNCPPGLTMEEYVKILAKRPKGPGGKDGDGDPGGCGGVLPAKDQATADAAAATWQGKVAAAAQEASQRGDLPGSLRGYIDRILKPKIDPWEVIRDFCVRHAKIDQSWSRLNRRHLARNVYLPSKSGVQLGNVFCFLDCSGSMDEEQMAKAAGFLVDLLTTNPGKLWLAYHDYEMQGEPVEWEAGDPPFRIERRGGGGTSHMPVFREMLGRCLEPSVILCFTDMETSFPEDPCVPTIWVSTKKNGITAPFGSFVSIA